MPNLIMAGVPGFESFATGLIRQTRNKGMTPVKELRDACIEAGVACQMTVDLFGWKKDGLMPKIAEWAGAATYLTTAKGADI